MIYAEAYKKQLYALTYGVFLFLFALVLFGCACEPYYAEEPQRWDIRSPSEPQLHIEGQCKVNL